MAGRKTLPLAEWLSAAGYEAWTPSIVVQRRPPRSTRAKVARDRPAPLLATFVFVRAHHVDDLLKLSADPVKECPDFSVLHRADRELATISIPLIRDSQLEPLRLAERKSAPREQRRVFAKGETVVPSEGPFSGMTGLVVSGNDRKTWVNFGGNAGRTQIETFILRPKPIEGDRANMARVAQRGPAHAS